MMEPSARPPYDDAQPHASIVHMSFLNDGGACFSALPSQLASAAQIADSASFERSADAASGSDGSWIRVFAARHALVTVYCVALSSGDGMKPLVSIA